MDFCDDQLTDGPILLFCLLSNRDQRTQLLQIRLAMQLLRRRGRLDLLLQRVRMKGSGVWYPG